MSENWNLIDFFKKEDFACRCGCGLNNISFDLVRKLNIARFLCGFPFIVNSAVRCISHNKFVSGSVSSSHLLGFAVDIAVKSPLQRFKMVQVLMSLGFDRIGIYKDFIHIDIDPFKTQNVIWHK